jgi:hypothetical protein
MSLVGACTRANWQEGCIRMASGLAASVKLTRQPRQLAPCPGTGARASAGTSLQRPASIGLDMSIPGTKPIGSLIRRNAHALIVGGRFAAGGAAPMITKEGAAAWQRQRLISQVRKRDGSNAEYSAWNIVSALIRAGAASGEFGRNGAGVLAERPGSSLLLSPSTRLFCQLASTVLSMNRVSLLKVMRQV